MAEPAVGAAIPCTAMPSPEATKPLTPNVAPAVDVFVPSTPTWSWSTRETAPPEPLPPNATPSVSAPVVPPPTRPLPGGVFRRTPGETRRSAAAPATPLASLVRPPGGGPARAAVVAGTLVKERPGRHHLRRWSREVTIRSPEGRFAELTGIEPAPSGVPGSLGATRSANRLLAGARLYDSLGGSTLACKEETRAALLTRSAPTIQMHRVLRDLRTHDLPGGARRDWRRAGAGHLHSPAFHRVGSGK
jgi:hypothetical protein